MYDIEGTLGISEEEKTYPQKKSIDEIVKEGETEDQKPSEKPVDVDAPKVKDTKTKPVEETKKENKAEEKVEEADLMHQPFNPQEEISEEEYNKLIQKSK